MDEGADPRQFARQMVEHLRALLLLRLESGILPPHVSDDMLPRLETQAAAFSRRDLAQAVRLFNQAANESKGGWQPQLPLEMAFIEAMLPPEPETPPRRSISSTSSTSSPATAPTRSASPPPSPVRSRTAMVREQASTYKSSASSAGSLTLETLRGCWSEFLDGLRPRDLSLEALIRSCDPVAVEGNVVVLGFTHNFHRSKVEEEQKKRIVGDVLSELFGQQCRVRCVLADQKQTGSTPQSPASIEQIVAEDPVVRAAVRDLGAQIVNS